MGVPTRLLFYVTAFAVYSYGLNYFLEHVSGHTLRQKSFGGEWKYLTYLNMWLQTLYYAGCLLSEIFFVAGLKPATSATARTLRTLVQRMHATASWPIGTFVVLSFWTLYSVDRELVYPAILDTFVPQWLNHVLHTIHIPFLLTDKYVTCYQYPSSKSGISVTVALASLYQIWVLYLALYHDIWVYRVLAVLPWLFKIVFFLLLWCALVLLYKTGQALSDRLWGKLQAVDVSRVKAKKIR